MNPLRIGSNSNPSIRPTATPLRPAAAAGYDPGMTLPLIAITIGDPAGIGPETIASAGSAEVHAFCRPLVVASRDYASSRKAAGGTTGSCGDRFARRSGWQPAPDAVPARAVSDEAAEVPPGVIDARAGQAAYDALVAARADGAGRRDRWDLHAACCTKARSGKRAITIPATPNCWPSCAAWMTSR